MKKQKAFDGLDTTNAWSCFSVIEMYIGLKNKKYFRDVRVEKK